jgi:hypothetical protein
MPDLVKMLRDLADAYEKEARQEAEGESTKATEERIAKLEQAVEQRSSSELDEAAEEISDEEWQLIERHRAGSSRPKPKPKPEADEKPRRTRPGRKSGNAYQYWVDDDGRVHKTDIAHIYSGDDEDDEVELPDEPEADVA